MSSTKSTSVAGGATASESKRSTLTITDNRTGHQYEIPVKDGAIRAMDLRQIKHDRRFRLDELRSGLHEYRFVHQPHHLH